MRCSTPGASGTHIDWALFGSFAGRYGPPNESGAR